jgi:uncharacterized damage-inducible protein DinB
MKEQLLNTIANSRAYTIKVVEAMPETHLGFKPSPGSMTFQELIHHIAYGIHWWEDNYVKGTKTDWNPPAAPGTRAQLLNALDAAYDSLDTTLRQVEWSDKTAYGVQATLDHITHHRGQATVLLRLQGIAPPDYSY